MALSKRPLAPQDAAALIPRLLALRTRDDDAAIGEALDLEGARTWSHRDWYRMLDTTLACLEAMWAHHLTVCEEKDPDEFFRSWPLRVAAENLPS